jgi:hypothetical protein
MNVKDESGNILVPRYEFRIFGSDLTEANTKLARLLSPLPGTRGTSDLYLLSRQDEEHIIKVRDNSLQIKKLLRVEDGYEQWLPELKKPFPVSSRLLVRTVFPALGVSSPQLHPIDCTLEAFVAAVEAHPEIKTARVYKQRRSYRENGTLCETVKVTFDGIRQESICCEAPLLDDLKRCVHRLGFEGYENVNYARAIKRASKMGG